MWKNILLLASAVALVLVGWEYATHLSDHLLFVLPAPSKILATLFEMKGRFWFHTRVTLFEMCGGFLLALCAAFPLAWTMLRYHSSRTLLQPLFILIQCLPMFTLAPIMVIWFGWGYTAIVIPTALMIFFPLTLNIYQGLRATPRELLEFFQANQATAMQTFFKLRLPWARSHIFAGFRISAAIAGVGAVAGEWAGAQNGLGILMLESRRNSDLEITFAALLCLTLMSSSLYLAMLAIEKRSFSFKGLFPLLLASSFLTGCNSGPKQMRLLLDWLPNANHIPLYVGQKRGYFAEEGIDLSIQKMQDNGGGISYLTSNQADLLVSHMPSTLRAVARGADLRCVGYLIKQPLRGLIFRKGIDVKRPADLSSFVLGYCIGSSDTSFLDFLMDQGEIRPGLKKNVSVDLISAIATGRVDFLYGGFRNIEPAQLRSLGVETGHVPMEDLGIPSFYEMIILSNGAHVCEKGFRRALHKSITFCQQHPKEAFEIYATANPDKRAKTLAWEEEAWKITLPLLAEDQVPDHELICHFHDWQLEQGFLPRAVDLGKIFQ